MSSCATATSTARPLALVTPDTDVSATENNWINVGSCEALADLESVVAALQEVWHERYDYRIEANESYELLIRHA